MIYNTNCGDFRVLLTNMLTLSGMKAKIRERVSIFFSIVLLYSAKANVEENTKVNYSYSFISRHVNQKKVMNMFALILVTGMLRKPLTT
jgi:hypothetical protein